MSWKLHKRKGTLYLYQNAVRIGEAYESHKIFNRFLKGNKLTNKSNTTE